MCLETGMRGVNRGKSRRQYQGLTYRYYFLIVRKDASSLYPIMMSQKKEIDIRDMPGATWRDVVAAVLESCPEAVPLSYLYEKIEPYSKAQKNKWWKEKIRQTLQCNPKYFNHDGRGLWSLYRKIA